MLTLADLDTYPDFPTPGVLFYDISPILSDPVRFRKACQALTPPATQAVDLVAGIDARGFIFAPVIAQSLDVGLTMVRKDGKLPGNLLKAQASKEYGSSDLTLNPLGIAGKHVLVVDDVLATGGTASAVAELLLRAEAASVSFAFLLELGALNGRAVLADFPIATVIQV